MSNSTTISTTYCNWPRQTTEINITFGFAGVVSVRRVETILSPVLMTWTRLRESSNKSSSTKRVTNLMSAMGSLRSRENTTSSKFVLMKQIRRWEQRRSFYMLFPHARLSLYQFLNTEHCLLRVFFLNNDSNNNCE